MQYHRIVPRFQRSRLFIVKNMKRVIQRYHRNYFNAMRFRKIHLIRYKCANRIYKMFAHGLIVSQYAISLLRHRSIIV